MRRLALFHVLMLTVLFVGAIAVVVSRGVTGRGVTLLVGGGALVGFRWWQFVRSRPAA